jgi:hypothetical protein
MTATNKRLLISESRSDLNQCTPYRGKPDQHDTYTSHASSCTPGIRFLRAVPTRGNLSWDANRFGQIQLLPRKRAPDTIYRTPADRSWSRGRKLSSCRWPTTRLTGPISPICDWYVQYLLLGANPSVLNQHRQGLQPWRLRLATYPLLDLPNQLSPIST